MVLGAAAADCVPSRGADHPNSDPTAAASGRPSGLQAAERHLGSGQGSSSGGRDGACSPAEGPAPAPAKLPGQSCSGVAAGQQAPPSLKAAAGAAAQAEGGGGGLAARQSLDSQEGGERRDQGAAAAPVSLAPAEATATAAAAPPKGAAEAEPPAATAGADAVSEGKAAAERPPRQPSRSAEPPTPRVLRSRPMAPPDSAQQGGDAAREGRELRSASRNGGLPLASPVGAGAPSPSPRGGEPSADAADAAGQQQQQQQHSRASKSRAARLGGPLYASEVVGRRCAILRCARGSRASWWEKARIIDYDPAKQRHKLLYITDGRAEEWQSLADVKFKWDGLAPPGAAPNPTYRPGLDREAAVGRRLRLYWPAMQVGAAGPGHGACGAWLLASCVLGWCWLWPGSCGRGPAPAPTSHALACWGLAFFLYCLQNSACSHI
jgi:hypothetical protein